MQLAVQALKQPAGRDEKGRPVTFIRSVKYTPALGLGQNAPATANTEHSHLMRSTIHWRRCSKLKKRGKKGVRIYEIVTRDESAGDDEYPRV